MIILSLAALTLLPGCGAAEAMSVVSYAVDTKAPITQTGAGDTEELYKEAKAAASENDYEESDNPVPTGINQKENEKVIIDWSYCDEGLVSVKYLENSDTTIRVQICKEGSENDYGFIVRPLEWEAFPLSEGDGNYKLSVYKNMSGSKYALLLSAEFDVKLSSELAPFTKANQYVNINKAPVTRELAKLLAAGKKDPFDVVNTVFDFTVAHLSYDKELAETVQGGYVPELDKVLERRKGICFDYAALMTGLLRSAGIPSKLVTGYAGGVYHAWISVWSEEKGWIDNVIYFDGEGWQRMDPTFADSIKSEKNLRDYIGDGNNYTEKFYY